MSIVKNPSSPWQKTCVWRFIFSGHQGYRWPLLRVQELGKVWDNVVEGEHQRPVTWTWSCSFLLCFVAETKTEGWTFSAKEMGNQLPCNGVSQLFWKYPFSLLSPRNQPLHILQCLGHPIPQSLPGFCFQALGS